MTGSGIAITACPGEKSPAIVFGARGRGVGRCRSVKAGRARSGGRGSRYRSPTTCATTPRCAPALSGQSGQPRGGVGGGRRAGHGYAERHRPPPPPTNERLAADTGLGAHRPARGCRAAVVGVATEVLRQTAAHPRRAARVVAGGRPGTQLGLSVGAARRRRVSLRDPSMSPHPEGLSLRTHSCSSPLTTSSRPTGAGRRGAKRRANP